MLTLVVDSFPELILISHCRQARNLQSSLAALAEKIDEVKNDHDKLETENRFLQDYIGGLTRTMSRDNLGRSASTSGRKKGRR